MKEGPPGEVREFPLIPRLQTLAGLTFAAVSSTHHINTDLQPDQFHLDVQPCHHQRTATDAHRGCAQLNAAHLLADIDASRKGISETELGASD